MRPPSGAAPAGQPTTPPHGLNLFPVPHVDRFVMRVHMIEPPPDHHAVLEHHIAIALPMATAGGSNTGEVCDAGIMAAIANGLITHRTLSF